MSAAIDAGVPARSALPLAELAVPFDVSDAADPSCVADNSIDWAQLPDRALTQGELVRLAATVAVRTGLWRDEVAFDAVHRHYVCLHRDTNVDVWLLCWTASNDTGWHDHDISSGAVAVVQGRLTEHNLTVDAPSIETPIDAGQVFSFGPDHIHRLSGALDSPTDTVSIHAYSPPLWRLGQYVVSASGQLRRMSVSYTDELRPIEEPA